MSVVVEKSASDDREYSYLTLPNGLEILCISEPEADKVRMVGGP